jgi:hypothetical protein
VAIKGSQIHGLLGGLNTCPTLVNHFTSFPSPLCQENPLTSPSTI